MDKVITITHPDTKLKYLGELKNFIHYKLLNVLSDFDKDIIGTVLAKFFGDSVDKHGADAVLSYMGNTFKREHKMQQHEVINNLLSVLMSLVTDYVSGGGETKLIEDGANGLVSLAMSFLVKPTTPAAPAATAATPPPVA